MNNVIRTAPVCKPTPKTATEKYREGNLTAAEIILADNTGRYDAGLLKMWAEMVVGDHETTRANWGCIA